MPNVAEIFKDMSYGPAPEQHDYVLTWLDDRNRSFGMFIDGTWTAPSDSTIASKNPATGEHLATISVASQTEVNNAVAAAKAALPVWQKLSGHQRAKYLYALARLVQKNSRFLAVLETLDNGKSIRETRDIDIPLVARHFYHHAGWAQLLESEFPDRTPLGVVGQIIPWNFPLLMLAWKIAPALAAGNTVVLKPAEYTSLSALYFAELCEEAGLPKGVVNIVTGAGETGALITEHPDISKIAFTGSTEVGRIIRRSTAGTGKKLSLELGGKSPFIIFEDADIDGAIEGLVDAIWFNQGEVCCAGSRLLVEESIADKVVRKIKSRLEKFRLGDPLDKTIDMGALVDPIQKSSIEAKLQSAVSEGAELWQPNITCPTAGSFLPPTLLTNVSPSNSAVREEIFGPVLTTMSFRTLDEAVSLANNTRYGLAASIWSENINRALSIANAVKAGVIWINGTNQFDAAVGFGGYRESGFGREGGSEGMLEYLKPNTDWLGDTASTVTADAPAHDDVTQISGVDRTYKNYIGGKQSRPDGGNTRVCVSQDGKYVGRVSDGNRKDIRDAVEAAFKANAWGSTTAHNRAQIMYYIAENLDARAQDFAKILKETTGVTARRAQNEVEMAISRLFSYGAWADKFDGHVHTPPARSIALSVHEPIGVVGVACPDTHPLLSFISLMAPLMAMGNRCIVIPSQRFPTPAMEFYQVLETSDVPAGVINIVTGDRDTLSKTLSEHDQVDGFWYHGSADGSAMVERSSADNLKRTWVNNGRARDWFAPDTGEGRRFLEEACQVKNIWLPYGD